MKLEKNFEFKEFTSTSYRDVEADNIYYAVDNLDKVKELAKFAQKVRDIIKSPMTITSGVRCPKLNTQVGGAKNSDHVKCLAIDFITTKIGIKKAFDLIRQSKLKFGQLILERNTWIHISSGDKKEVMTYNGERYERI